MRVGQGNDEVVVFTGGVIYSHLVGRNQCSWEGYLGGGGGGGGGGGIVGFTSLVKIEDASYDCPAMVLDHIEDCSLPRAQSLHRP